MKVSRQKVMERDDYDSINLKKCAYKLIRMIFAELIHFFDYLILKL